MTPCGMNHVTPTMIKNGQMAVGDKISFEDENLSAPESIPAANNIDPTAENLQPVTGFAVTFSEYRFCCQIR